MEQEFYKGRLRDRFGIDVLLPNPEQRRAVHSIIYNELCLGSIQEASRKRYLRIIGQLQEAGAEAVILGCTEIALLVQQVHTPVPLYDTTALHAAQAVRLATADGLSL